MKDLEKMKKDFEQSMFFAQKENELQTFLSDNGLNVAVSVIGHSFTQKGKLQTSIYFSPDCSNVEQCAAVLRTLSATEKSDCYAGKGKYQQMDYELQTHRGVRECFTKLNVNFIYEEYDISVEMEITGSNLLNYFKEKTRELTDSEVNIYLGSKTRWNYNQRNFFKYLVFNNGKVVNFHGGYCKLVEEAAANEIIEYIKTTF